MVSPDKKEVWGRPTGVLVMQDGSLLVSDDGGGKIWRVYLQAIIPSLLLAAGLAPRRFRTAITCG